MLMKVILVDDEQLALNYLSVKLSKIKDVRVVDMCINPLLAEHSVRQNKPDVAFLDINMPEINGIELAERLLEIRPHLIIVFITAYNEYAVKAFELNALDYVLKPVSNQRLKKTIDRVRTELESLDIEIGENSEFLHINLCNYLSFQLDREELNVIQWRTARARELFLYLLQNSQQYIRKEALVDVLWQDESTESSLQHLYTTVYHVRQTLQPFQKFLQLKNTSEGYLLGTHNVVVDFWEWENQLTNLPALNEAIVQTYEDVMGIVTGPYLGEYDYMWLEPIRRRYEQLWLRKAMKLADYYYDSGMYELAIEWCSHVLSYDDAFEECAFLLMKVYASLKSDLLVQQHYYELVEKLDSQLNAKPSRKVENWFRAWEEETFKKK